MSAILKITAIIGLLFVSHVASAQTTFCIVYSPSESVARRIITPTKNAECNDPSILMQGEAVLVLPLAKHTGDKNIASALVAQATGIPTTTDNCALATTPLPPSAMLQTVPVKIVSTFLCDPAIDGPPTKTVVVASDANVASGDLWDGTQIDRNYTVVDPATCKVEELAVLPLNNPVSPLPGTILLNNSSDSVGVGMTLKGCTVGQTTP